MIDPRRFTISYCGASIAALLLGLGMMLSPRSTQAKRLAPPPAVWDQGVTPEQRKAAQLLFEDARTHLHAGLVAQAAEDYRQALRLWPHPITHFNLALALINLDQLVEADEHLEKALEYGMWGLADDGERFEYAKQKRLELGRRLATVVVSCRQEGVKVFIDREHVLTIERGKPGTVSKRIRVDKHAIHQFVAEIPGGEVVIERRGIGPGETVRLEIEEQGKAVSRVPWALMAGGVLVGIAGGSLQSSAEADHEAYNQKVDACVRCASDYGYLRERSDTKRTLSIVSFSIAGAAVALAGGIFLNRPVVHRIKNDQHHRTRFSIAPLVSSDAGGAMVMGQF